MTSKSDNENNHTKDKMHKDRFRITIVGVLIYSLALITVMVLSYTGVKAVFRNYDVNAAKETDTEDSKSEEPEEETAGTPTPEPKEEPEEEPIKDHVVSADKLVDPETGVLDYSITRFTP